MCLILAKAGNPARPPANIEIILRTPPLFPSIIFLHITNQEATQKQAVNHYSQFFPTFAKLTHDSSNDLATLITYANLSGHHITGNL